MTEVETNHHDCGLVETVSSWDHPEEGYILDQVKFDYNAYNLLTADWQDHDGAVNGDGYYYTPVVRYHYSDPTYGSLYRTGMTYPNEENLNYHPHSAIDSALNRVGGISTDSRHIAS